MNNIIFGIVLILLGCKVTQKQPITQNDRCSTLKTIDYQPYYGKSIEYLLSNEQLKDYKVSKKPYFTEPSYCLSFIRIGFGDGAYLDIYPEQEFKFSKRCREKHNWDFDSLKKELVSDIVVQCW